MKPRKTRKIGAGLILVAAVLVLLCGGSGCTVVSYNRVFPKLTWYWSAEAKEQRREKAAEKANAAGAVNPGPAPQKLSPPK